MNCTVKFLPVGAPLRGVRLAELFCYRNADGSESRPYPR
jgi:hypothetical protein